jgi:VWFA-related protein
MTHQRSWTIAFSLVVILSCLLPGWPSTPPTRADETQAGRRAEPRPRPQPNATEPETEQSGRTKDKTDQKKPDAPKPDVIAPPTEIVTLGAELVSVPVVVFDKKGNLYTKMTKDNFTVFEDGVKQDIVTFSSAEAPVTMVILLEFSKVFYTLYSLDEVINPLRLFVERFIKPGDYIAVVAYDIRPKVLNDFTGDSGQLMQSVYLLYRNYPAFSEANLFDALKFILQGGTVDGETYTGLASVRGRTAVLLVASGFDTFSKINYDEARKIVANAGVPIYAIGVGELVYRYVESGLSGPARLDFLQAQNQLRTFSDSTGGRYYNVIFQAAVPSVLDSIMTMMRNQYVVGYSPGNPRRQGKKREIKILVDVDGDGKPDNKNLEVQHREFYIEPKDAKK